MLEIKQLNVAVEGKEILHDINLKINTGETHALFGPNGSGKTTLLMAIMGFPRYQVTKGQILFRGKDITRLGVDERARLGIGISFQRPPVVRGVKTRDMVNAALRGKGDEKTIDKLAERTDLTGFLDRDINYGAETGAYPAR
jgi:Fe-S cluster assembly ATP-binding protein